MRATSIIFAAAAASVLCVGCGGKGPVGLWRKENTTGSDIVTFRADGTGTWGTVNAPNLDPLRSKFTWNGSTITTPSTGEVESYEVTDRDHLVTRDPITGSIVGIYNRL
jgi:hypothetical protein